MREAIAINVVRGDVMDMAAGYPSTKASFIPAIVTLCRLSIFPLEIRPPATFVVKR